MRKVGLVLLLSTLLLSLAATSVLAGGVVKLGADVAGKVKAQEKLAGVTLGEDEEDTKTGFSIGFDYYFDLSEKLAVGAGAEYQLNRKVDGAAKGFNFIPFFALGRYQLSPTLYLTGKVGYNLFQVEDADELEGVEIKGGFCYGIGGGTIFSDFLQLEILYSVNNGKMDAEFFDLESELIWKYSKIGVSLGYKF